jgi:dTDP-4-dehydrorhamnose 3,5-epimerase-like enzyme
MNKSNRLIQGNSFIDDRGKLDYFNDFNMSPIKRVYFTTHFNLDVVRAWQGHTVESRWFICVSGSFNVKLIKMDNWEAPSNLLPVENYVLNSEKKQVLFIPNGNVNGFRALKTDSKLMIMSNYNFNEIEDDLIRFDQNKWNEWDN